ncbi:hypothetical protein ACSBR1_008618 [Camellia fascicularis]
MAIIIKLIEDFKAGVNSWKHVKNSFDNWRRSSGCSVRLLVDDVSKKLEVAGKDYTSQWPTRYSYADIKRITNQFMEKLGQGGYGTVYKGMLSHEIFVAVKVLNNSRGNGEDFINELGTIGKICHVNIVYLVGFCADGFARALVYRFLPNDSLEKNLGKVSYKATSQMFIVMERCCLKWLKGERTMLQLKTLAKCTFQSGSINSLEQGQKLWIQVDKDEDAKIAKKLTIMGDTTMILSLGGQNVK